MAERIQRKRAKGWRKPEGAVYVGRGSWWGNPASVSKSASGWDMVISYPDGAESFFDTETYGTRHEAHRMAVLHFTDMFTEAGREAARAELAGKDLMCWCPLDLPCHADVLLEIANGGAHRD